MRYPRHTLIDISLSGRKRLLDEAVSRGMEPGYLGQMLLPEEFPMLDTSYMPYNQKRRPIPGIVRRETGLVPEKHISVGLVSWECGPMGRMRLPAQVRLEEIEAVHSPMDVLVSNCRRPEAFFRTPCLRALWRLKEQAKTWSMAIGVWGSAAMELHTGYLYTHEGSDLDFFLQPRTKISGGSLADCFKAILDAEQAFQVRIDAELSLPGGYGISLKELMSASGASVLGKGLHDVVLIQKNEILGSAEGALESTEPTPPSAPKGPVPLDFTPRG